MDVLKPMRPSSEWLIHGLLLSILCLTLTFHWTKGQMTPEIAKDILMKHNEYRRMERSSDMYQLYWNVSLQERADGWVQRCDFQHELNLDVGENLYFNTDHENPDVLLRGLQIWYEEKSNWGYSNGHCTSSCHYTQMVSSYTTTVGCAAHLCPVLKTPTETFQDAIYLACYYYPRGNLIGNFPYKRGLPCSKCGEGDICSDKLCVSAEPLPETAPDIIKYLIPQKPPLPHRLIKRLADYQSLEPNFKQNSANHISKGFHHVRQYSHQVISRRRQAATRVVVKQPDSRRSEPDNLEVSTPEKYPPRSQRSQTSVIENDTPSSDVVLSRLNQRSHHHRRRDHLIESRAHRRHGRPSHRGQREPRRRSSYHSYTRNQEEGPQSSLSTGGYHNKRRHRHHGQPIRPLTSSTSTATKPTNRVAPSNEQQRINGGVDNRIPQTPQHSPLVSHPNRNHEDGLYQYYQSRGSASPSKSSRLVEPTKNLGSSNTIDAHFRQGNNAPPKLPKSAAELEQNEVHSLEPLRGHTNDIRLQGSETDPEQNTPGGADGYDGRRGHIETNGDKGEQNVATMVRVRYHVRKHHGNNQPNSSSEQSRRPTDNLFSSHNTRIIRDPAHFPANYAVGRLTSRVQFNELNRIEKQESGVNNARTQYEPSIASGASKTDITNTRDPLRTNQIDRRSQGSKGASSQIKSRKRRRGGKKRRRRNRADNETILRRRRERRAHRRQQKEASRAWKRYKRRLEREHKKLLQKEEKRRQKLAQLEKKRVEKLRRQEKNRDTCIDKVLGCSQRVSTCQTSLLAKYYCPMTCGLCKSNRREPGGQRQPTGNNVNYNRNSNNANNADRQKNYDLNLTSRRGDRYNYTTKRTRQSSGNVVVNPRAQRPQPYFYGGRDRSYGRRTTAKPELTTQRLPGVPDTTGPCRDDPRYARGCSHWASIGHCTKNTRIRTVFCRRSCGVCV